MTIYVSDICSGFISSYHAKKVMGPQLSSPCYTNEPISVCMHKILSLSIWYFVTVLRNVLVLSLSGRHIRLIACCYFVWEPRVNNVISREPILTQYCIPWICDKICQTATFTTRWHSNIFSVSRPLILILSRFKERESSHVFFTKCNIKSNTLWPLWRGINDEHGRRQMYRFSFLCSGFEVMYCRVWKCCPPSKTAIIWLKSQNQ